jgi:hypothetical protein
VVVDSMSGFPLYGVAIATTTTPDRTASDSTGAFSFTVPAGTVMVTFLGRGFEGVGQLVSSTEDVDMGRVVLLPEAIALAPITASVSKLDRRIRQFTGSTRVFDNAILNHSGDSNLLEFMRHRVPTRETGCNAMDSSLTGECFRVRGYPVRPLLYIDEVQISGMQLLSIYRPEDVARVEVFSGGRMVRVYTRNYMETLASSNRAPDSLPPL